MAYTLTIGFTGIGQVPPELRAADPRGASDEHTIAGVTYTIAVDGRQAGTFSSLLKRTPGTSGRPGISIEVSLPVPEWHGPFDYQQFSEAARKYYQSAVAKCLGGSGGAILSLRDNHFSIPSTVSFKVNRESDHGW
jgi:hypothetical protein